MVDRAVPDEGEMSPHERAAAGYPWRPIPDPTALTTEALLREIANLDKLTQARIELVQLAVHELKEDCAAGQGQAAAQLEALRVKQDERAEAANARSNDRLAALQPQIEAAIAGIKQRIASLVAALDERYATQSKALDAAFIVADKAVQAALESAEKAVAKAEVANEKRFDSMLAALNQLTARTGELMPRSEADVGHKAIENINRATERFNDLAHRIDRIEGVSAGASGRDQKVMAVIGAIAATVSILVAVGAVIALIVK